MRILFVGVLDVDWSTNCSMQRALERLGHSVVPFSYRTISADFNTRTNFGLLDKLKDKGASFLRSDRIPVNSTWYYRRNGRKEMNTVLLETVKSDNFDLVLLSKTDTVDYNLIPGISRYSPIWYFFMDPIDQAIRINAKKYAANSTWSSATFSDVTGYFKKAGANAYWITQGVDTDIFKPETVNKIHDVVFVGTRTTDRSHYINALRNTGISVTCFGEGWENPSVYQEELVNIYRTSRIVLNFCRPGAGFSIRVFQVMGSGAFLLSEYCPDLAKLFKQGEHLDWFTDQEEILKKVRYYLSNDAVSIGIAINGCDHVHKNHSWEAVMHSIINIAENRNDKIINS